MKVGEVDKKDFEDDIVVKKFGWTCDNLSKFKNHLTSKQTLIISQFEKNWKFSINRNKIPSIFWSSGWSALDLSF